MSIFDLKTSSSELESSNHGISNLAYDQITPTRDVAGNNFPSGSINFRWQTGGTRWFMPSRSYIRMRCQLTDQAGLQLTESAGISPAMNLASTIFQSCEIRINDKTIGRVADFVPQVDALENRITKSKSWLDSIGNSSNFWEKSFQVRQTDVTSDGKTDESEKKQTRVQLGVGVTQQIAIDAAGLLTQSVDTAVDLTSIFVVGDSIELAVGANDVQRYYISAVNANTLQLNDVVTTPQGAAVVAWSRIRKSEGRNVSNFEVTWIPPLNLFKILHALPPNLKFELVLTPQTSSVYQKYAIESALGLGDKVPNLATTGTPSVGSNFKFNIVDMYLYANVVEGPRFDSGTFLLDLEQTRCQSQKIDAPDLSQKQFEVSPSAYALTVAYDDIRSGTNTMVPSSKFKAFNAGLTAGDEELKLTRWYIQYAGRSTPSPDASPEFKDGTDNTTQRYIDSQLQTGSYYNVGGSETIQDFHDRGSYYYNAFPKDAGDRSTRVVVNQQFEGTVNWANLRVLLFDHTRSVARISIDQGFAQIDVVDV